MRVLRRNKETGDILNVERSYNGDECYCCNQYTYELVDGGYSDEHWLVDDVDDAHNVLHNQSVGWYNSLSTRPCCTYTTETHEVVKITIETTVEREGAR